MKDGRRCPKCNNTDTKVAVTRYSTIEGKYVRTRVCSCGMRWQTAEVNIVDARREKYGTWEIYGSKDIGATNCRCKACRTEFFFPLIQTYPYRFCPNCGAEMVSSEKWESVWAKTH